MRSRTRVWALIGGGVAVGAVIAIAATALLGGSEPAPSPSRSTPSSTSSTSVTPRPSPDPEQPENPAVTAEGWVSEPATTDRSVYVRAAISAASTFDTTRAPRDAWLSHLDSWFTPDTRYDEASRVPELEAAQLELRQAVVLPGSEWLSLAEENGRVVAAVAGEIAWSEVPEDPAGVMSIGTADVVLTFTRSDGGDGELSYDESVRVSVQVLCGEGSVPAPGSAQEPGDCKVVRYFPEPLEP